MHYNEGEFYAEHYDVRQGQAHLRAATLIVYLRCRSHSFSLSHSLLVMLAIQMQEVLHIFPGHHVRCPILSHCWGELQRLVETGVDCGSIPELAVPFCSGLDCQVGRKTELRFMQQSLSSREKNGLLHDGFVK